MTKTSQSGGDPGSDAGLRWRVINAPHLVALVRAIARFESGQLVARPSLTDLRSPQPRWTAEVDSRSYNRETWYIEETWAGMIFGPI
jgi:hypothetical protein